MTQFNRFFAFGDSWTRYKWPTWADIIAYDLNIPATNYGIQGVGNVGIQHRILQCDLEHNITTNDLIIVGWSTWGREDRYHYDGWRAIGEVVRKRNNKIYNKDFIDIHWSDENDIVKNATAIIVANRITDIDCQFTIEGIDNDAYHKIAQDGQNNYFMDLLNALPRMPVYPNEPEGSKWQLVAANDRHPSVNTHLQYAIQMYTHLGLTMNPTTIEVYNNYHDLIYNKMQSTPGVEFHEISEKFYDANKELKKLFVIYQGHSKTAPRYK
jgi:hypothetical protein